MIQIKALNKVYGTGKVQFQALKNVDITIKEGEFVVLAGPSGSGKSTLLNIIGGMDTATSGSVLVNGQDIVKLNKRQLTQYRKSQLGFIFQKFNLIDTLTVFENVEFTLMLKKWKKADRRALVMDMLKNVGLDTKEKNFPKNLSGGQQQRVAIARALVGNPVVILADEPTANLDSKNGKECIEMLHRLNKEKNVTIILTTHDQRIIDTSDNVIYLVDGQIDQVRTSHKNKGENAS